MIQDAKLPAAMHDGELEDANRTRNAELIGVELGTCWDAEWRTAVLALTEVERAPYDAPHVYADTHGSGCGET